MFKMAGELLPGVLHVSARAVASQALSIFGDHSDVMATRQTGFALLASSGVQEVMHIGAVAHLAAIKGRVPFLHFFDGFRTSHEAQKIETIDYEDFDKMVDHEAIAQFRQNALNPEHPVLRGTAQNPDIFFQAREASNPYYNAIPGVVEEYMNEINKITGRNYGLFNYHGAPDAENIIIVMGSACEAVAETVDYLNAKGEKVGMVAVHLYRPFSAEHFLKVIPASVKKIAVLDRTKEPGSLGEPLYQDVCTVYFEKGGAAPSIIGGRYGLGSKDVFPSQIVAVFENLKQAKPVNHFTVGIVDDVTNTSLTVGEYLDVVPKDTYSAKFWGIGSDGTVGANKNSIKIIGDYTDKYAQAYFSYDSKKSGGITQSHLRFGSEPIRSTYLVKAADFVACHNASYVDKYDMLTDLKPGGTFLLNCLWSDEELSDKLPAHMRRALVQKNAKLYVIDATTLAGKIGLGRRINSILQAAFFKLTDIIPINDAVKYMKEAIQETYGRRGEKIVSMNHASIDAGVENVREVKIPADWANAVDAPAPDLSKLPAFVRDFAMPINALRGDFIPVSAFKGREDGTFEQGTAAYEKRGVAVDVPKWIHENCIQCNRCVYACPHATIRPFLMTDEEVKSAPSGFVAVKTKGKEAEQYQYRLQVSPLDCYGCGVCATECPTKDKALVMEPFESRLAEERDNWNYVIALDHKDNPFDKFTVKGSQFEVPLLEFSGACAGCGETPYTKLITQLYGDRLYIGNATGCSSIWGGSAPSTPYCKNAKGQGPTWANSLFEDTAEFSMGFQLAIKQRRNKLAEIMTKLVAMDLPAAWGYKEAAQEWLDSFNCGEGSKVASDKVRAANKKALAECGSCGCEADALFKHVCAEDDMLVKKSVWAFGGDGWAYDIGYGGLDHVIASGEDVNMLVMDTEVYSNTGGQSSKASPTASVAKFTASGKKVSKKDLGQMAMSYGYVYVARIA
jgi:pyruvate-ferredoxin/flavodoxin oxidoreductase